MSKPKTTATATPREALHALLQELNFKGMAGVLDSELDRAERQGVSCAELVQRLLSEQASFQRERIPGQSGGAGAPALAMDDRHLSF